MQRAAWAAGAASTFACVALAVAVLFPTGAADDVSAEVISAQTNASWVHTPAVPTEPTTTTSSTTTSTTQAPTTTTIPASEIGNSGEFALPPGAALPSDAACAAKVTHTREYKPANSKPNHTKPSSKPTLTGNFGSDPVANRYLARVDGNFTGTTDEILQWASCKWGLDVDVTRANAVVESNWNQNSQGGVQTDPTKCVDGMQAPCALAFGILQVRADFHPNTYPSTAQSTAFDVDYALALRRTCYDGHSYLGNQTRGNAWGCVGAYNSGGWLDPAAQSYIAQVQSAYTARPWRKW
jgi:hypothetical protein